MQLFFPPTIIVRVAFFAPEIPPDTGASKKLTPILLSSSDILIVDS